MNEKARGASLGKFRVKLCGKAHAYCNVCKPVRKKGPNLGFRDKTLRQRAQITRNLTGNYNGDKNPNWKGGISPFNDRTGWKNPGILFGLEINFVQFVGNHHLLPEDLTFII